MIVSLPAGEVQWLIISVTCQSTCLGNTMADSVLLLATENSLASGAFPHWWCCTQWIRTMTGLFSQGS